jgi:hypothetical protein
MEKENDKINKKKKKKKNKESSSSDEDEEKKKEKERLKALNAIQPTRQSVRLNKN